jgi:hypothetical protein
MITRVLDFPLYFASSVLSSQTIRADSHIPCRSHAVLLPRPCHEPAILRQCRTWGGRPHAVSGRQMLIHTHHAVPMPRLCRGLERWLSERHWNGTACVNQTRPHCVNQMGKTQSKPLAERHGNGMVCANPP